MEQIELRKHERFNITLKGLGSAGYRWSFTVDDPRFVSVERVQAAEREFASSGSVDEQFVLIAQSIGETMVRFRQSRSFEPSKPPIGTLEILVRVRAE